MSNRRTRSPRAFVVAMLACTVLLAACEPVDRRPGLWVSGDVVPTPSDWSFTAEHQEIFVETSTWYGIPHSVTTVVAPGRGNLYVPSIYDGPQTFPGNKRWNKNMAADSHVRLKIGDQVFEMNAVLAEDANETRAGLQALAAKYPFWRKALDDPDNGPDFVIIRMEPR